MGVDEETEGTNERQGYEEKVMKEDLEGSRVTMDVFVGGFCTISFFLHPDDGSP